MSTANGLFQLLVRCPRCEGRNAVDLRKQGLARRARCGRCGEPLPRRIPAPLLLLTVAVLTIAAGLLHFTLGAVRERRSTSRRARAEVLLQQGDAAGAVRLLPAPRRPGSADAVLGRKVAEALAVPVLAADADPSAGRAAVEAAVDLGVKLTDKHERDLPELLEVVDDPLRRLQARRIAFDILENAQARASSADPDLALLEKDLQDAALAAVDRPPDVAAAVETLSHGIRSTAVLARARKLISGKRADEARQLLARTAQRLPPPRATGLHELAPLPDEPPAGTLLELVGRIRDALQRRDRAGLQAAVAYRADASWDAASREELDREVRRACTGLASLSAEAASREWDPEKRARLLLESMTCDEVLPRDFVAAARVSLAETMAEAARRGGSLDDALIAWDGIESARREKDLAGLACLAETRGAHALAVHAWSRVRTAQALALLDRCAEGVEPPPPSSPPLLAYPAPGM